MGISVVLDRLIQKALQQVRTPKVLTPIFDPSFSDRSFGSRPGRSAHGALRQVQADAKAGYRIAVDLDLEKFFDRVNHDVLMTRVARRVADKRVLSLIGRYLRAGVLVDGAVQPTPWGTPQGGPISSLLANILLDDLDKELERRGHRFARYVDDVLIVVRSRRAAERVKASVTQYLTEVLKLSVHQEKSRIAKLDECVLLGFTFRGTKLRWSDQAYADFRHRLKRLTGRSWGVSMQHRLSKLRQYVRGWMGYFGISDYYRPVPGLDQWLRRRVRMCYWKQWRKTRTKVRHLLALGTSRRQAVNTASRRRGYRHLARTLATRGGTARCGPACRVVWGPGERNPRLPDYQVDVPPSTEPQGPSKSASIRHRVLRSLSRFLHVEETPRRSVRLRGFAVAQSLDLATRPGAVHRASPKMVQRSHVHTERMYCETLRRDVVPPLIETDRYVDVVVEAAGLSLCECR